MLNVLEFMVVEPYDRVMLGVVACFMQTNPPASSTIQRSLYRQINIHVTSSRLQDQQLRDDERCGNPAAEKSNGLQCRAGFVR